MKLINKNVMSANLHHQEDLSPVITISNVDAFHTLFVSMIMQQTSSSTTTTCMFVFIDFVQSAIAMYDVRQILTRLGELSDQIKRLDQQNCTSNSDGLLLSVAGLLETSETVHHHPSIAQPRHLRNPARPRASLCRRLLARTRLQVVAVQPIGPTCPSQTASAPHTKPLSELESAQVEYAQKALKLLHMTECYVLLEFVEAMIPTIYGTYVFAMSYMPNRVYYPNFAVLSASQLRTAAAQVAVYASLEVVSLIIFLWVLGKHIQGLSPVRQLAFVLRTQWKFIQSLCAVMVHMVAQIAFVHNGCDFTFRFEWLKRGNVNNSN